MLGFVDKTLKLAPNTKWFPLTLHFTLFLPSLVCHQYIFSFKFSYWAFSRDPVFFRISRNKIEWVWLFYPDETALCIHKMLSQPEKKPLTYKQRFPLTLKVLATITSHWGSVNEPTLLSWKTFSMGGPKGVAKIEPMKTLFISFCSCLLHTYIHILYLCSKFTE